MLWKGLKRLFKHSLEPGRVRRLEIQEAAVGQPRGIFMHEETKKDCMSSSKMLRGRVGGREGGRKGQMDGCRLSRQHTVTFLKKKDKRYLKDCLEHYPWKELTYFKI